MAMSITYIKLAFVGANVLPIFFLNDTFHSRYAKKPINESNDSDDSLEPKCGSFTQDMLKSLLMNPTTRMIA